MKKGLKHLAAALACVMMFSASACGNKNDEQKTPESQKTTEKDEVKESKKEKEEDKAYDQVVYAYATFNNIPTEEDLKPVQDAVNEISREKINAEVILKPIPIADYVNKVNLALQGGEKIDLFQSLGTFNSSVSMDMCYDISEMMDELAAGTKEAVGDKFLDACRVNGKLYGIPTFKPFALTPMLIFRADIAEEIGFDKETLTGVEDVTGVLEKVKEKHPEMTPLAPVQSGNIGLQVCMGDVDWLSDDYFSPVGVLLNGEMEVTDLYSSDVFKNRCDLARYWYQNDLVMKDAATTTSMAAELMASGNYFAYIAAYSYPEKDTAASLEAQSGGYPLDAKILDNAYLSTGDINAVSWMVASTTDVPEAALKFLDLTYTDTDVVNLLIYGIEGRDYVKKGNGTVNYPEGEDSTTVPYTAQLSCGTLGNFFNMYPMEGTDPASLEWELEQNQEAPTSPAMGFTFDSSSLTTQYTAVKNAISQYLPGLLCGSLDPDAELENFHKALKDAGYEDILNEKQVQLDAWLENNK